MGGCEREQITVVATEIGFSDPRNVTGRGSAVDKEKVSWKIFLVCEFKPTFLKLTHETK